MMLLGALRQFLALLVLSQRVVGFVPHYGIPASKNQQLHFGFQPTRGRFQQQLAANPQETDADETRQPAEASSEKEDLTDLDARVLQSMLQDGTVDLDTEQDMKNLLDRGTAPKDAPKFEGKESDSEFSSRIISTVADTKLWQALRMRADEFFESASIYVSNRVERDAKLLASIGVFAWERAKRDVARALPASQGAAKVVRQAALQLGNSSSVSEAIKTAQEKNREERNLEDVNLYDELNTPLDEIRSVTQSISDILKGDSTKSSTSRGLRSAAPAGDKTRTERQQRAYQKRKQTVLKREKEVVDPRRVAGGIADAAWSVKRDMEVESNKPGFKTERVRKAIAEGAKTTSRVIAAAKDGDRAEWRKILFGSEEEEQVLELESAQVESIEESLESLETLEVEMENLEVEMESLEVEIESVPEIPEIPELPDLPEIPPEPVLTIPAVSLPSELLDEQASVVTRLKLCIEKPEDTWLTPEVLANAEAVDPDTLTDVVTAMIFARDDLDVSDAEPETISELVSKLKIVKNNVDMAHSLAETAAGPEAAAQLRNFLYGSDPQDEIQPTLLALRDIQTIYERDVEEATSAAEAAFEVAVMERSAKIDAWESIFDEREQIVQEAKRAAESFAEVEASLQAKKAVAEQKAAEAAAEAAAAAEQERAAEAEKERLVDAVIVDATPIDVKFEPSGSNEAQVVSSSSREVEVITDDNSQGFFAEVVSDFEDDDNNFRTVSAISEDDEEEEPNVAAQAALRSLDVVFSLLEKLLLLLPGFFQLLGTASKRVEASSRTGLGRIGWSRIENTQKGAKRY